MMTYSRPLLFKQMLEKLTLDRWMRQRTERITPQSTGAHAPVALDVERIQALSPATIERVALREKPATTQLPRLSATVHVSEREIPDISTIRLNERLALLLKKVPIEDMHTDLLPAVHLPPVMTEYQTDPMNSLPVEEPVQVSVDALPRDAQGRYYVSIIDPRESTYDLVDMIVERYYEAVGSYPTVVLLSAFRYLIDGLEMKHYYPRRPGAERIPFEYENDSHYDVSYDVLCRGE